MSKFRTLQQRFDFNIEFNRDAVLFAIAGVQKKIKIFDYASVMRNSDYHYPEYEMQCNSKISSVAWNPYRRNILASSDYEGVISVWDVYKGTRQMCHEHEKRCWSVNFNNVDPKILASGSDDHKVKIWTTETDRSVTHIEAKANVCCVEFSPDQRHSLIFGSADHCVHYYDLRQTRQAVQVFRGHRKAVSYSKFVDSDHVVSASTDSTLRLWCLSKGTCERVFTGHTNEKNFVGLSSDGRYIACGSENNQLYIYYRGLQKDLLRHKFEPPKSMSIMDTDVREEDSNEFVSAVCWKPNTNVVLAANSKGTVKVLQLE